MIIAITGYIGSGKTTSARFLADKGFKIIEADLLGHLFLERSDIKEKIRAAFGINALGRDLKVDRQKLAKIVFGNSIALNKLNEIVHPYLIRDLKQKIQETSQNVIIDAALYYELEIDKIADITILVTADVSNIYERLNPEYTKEQILNVMNNQRQPIKPSYSVENNGCIQELKNKIEKIIDEIL